LFEIALTEYKGKVYGYSRSEFIVNDTLYYIVKRVKGTITGDICEVTDDDIIAYNFRGKLDKGIKVTSTFRRNGADSSWYLAGNWKTNATKKYYSVTGKVDLEQEKDLTASKIFPHLEELNLAKNIDFYQERNETSSIVRIAKPEKIKTEYATGLDPAGTDLAVSSKPATMEIADVIPAEEPEAKTVGVQKPAETLPKTGTKDIAARTRQAKPAASGQTATINKPVIPEEKPRFTTSTNETAKSSEPEEMLDLPPLAVDPAQKRTIASVNNRPNPKISTSNTSGVTANNPAPGNTAADGTRGTVAKSNSGANPVIPHTQTAAVSNQSVATSKPLVTAPRKTLEELTEPVTVIAGRLSEFKQVVNFKSDSLVLSLYDNGEIDGDTVSVLMNGELIMARQGLKATAIRKTIYIQPGQNEDFTLVLFAENLGKYPPNTGLLVVHDGDDTYHLRFSSDYEKSAGIVFRRK